MTLKTFMPKGDPSVSLAATTTSGATTASLDSFSNSVRVVNAGTAMAFIKFGTTANAPTAAVTDMPIASGATETFTKGTADKVAAITGTGTATVYFTNGEGL